ncbi:MAG: enoyl-CoA hydratase/isomerase family protein [Myxococcales bacterium]|nr:enoyl-CoA hydratase/isomerase family protein [Myxococcales bacterium]
MSYANILVEVHGPLGVLTINRPAQRNALSAAVLAELEAGVIELEANPAVRVVALAGAGPKAFVAGADIAEMAAMNSEQAQAFSQRGSQLGKAIERSRVPYVALVHGVALGGGCELALACDFIYATPAAKFGQPEVKLGVIPGFGGTQRLLRRVGLAKAKELCLTGDVITAEEALRIGLVDALVPDSELRTAADALAARIALNAPLAVAACKRVLDSGQSMALDEGLRVETQAFGHLFSSRDQREGMAAFLEKRVPAYTGS